MHWFFKLIFHFIENFGSFTFIIGLPILKQECYKVIVVIFNLKLVIIQICFIMKFIRNY